MQTRHEEHQETPSLEFQDDTSMHIHLHMLVPEIGAMVCQSLTLKDMGNVRQCCKALERWFIDWRQQLRELDLRLTKVNDLAALVNFPKLHTLSLSDTKVHDVAALDNCSELHTLLLGGTAKFVHIYAITLGNWTNLHTLDLSGNP